jgi:class 3 adenylate cyclase
VSAAPRILVVDDNDDNRYTLTERLKREGYADLAVAADGTEALAMIGSKPFDVVLLDVMLPGVGGVQVLEHMKGDPALRHVPVIMISALSDREHLVRCLELGAEDYLPKPFEPVVLRARLGACLDRKRLRDQEQAHLGELQVQRQQLDACLRAILPEPTVRELRLTGRIAPRRFDEVAVLFADIVGFTRYCDGRSPEAVVSDLDRFACLCEELFDLHGLEKIKTVGDAVLATANLLEPHADPVLATVQCARAILDAAQRLPSQWTLRAGVHVGPVVAGVIGHEKFSFDVWGDTVNVAARLAEAADAAAVYLTQDAWDRLGGRVPGTPLGRRALKGKRPVQVYRCVDRAAPADAVCDRQRLGA